MAAGGRLLAIKQRDCGLALRGGRGAGWLRFGRNLARLRHSKAIARRGGAGARCCTVWRSRLRREYGGGVHRSRPVRVRCGSSTPDVPSNLRATHGKRQNTMLDLMSGASTRTLRETNPAKNGVACGSFCRARWLAPSLRCSVRRGRSWLASRSHAVVQTACGPCGNDEVIRLARPGVAPFHPAPFAD